MGSCIFSARNLFCIRIILLVRTRRHLPERDRLVLGDIDQFCEVERPVSVARCRRQRRIFSAVDADSRNLSAVLGLEGHLIGRGGCRRERSLTRGFLQVAGNAGDGHTVLADRVRNHRHFGIRRNVDVGQNECKEVVPRRLRRDLFLKCRTGFVRLGGGQFAVNRLGGHRHLPHFRRRDIESDLRVIFHVGDFRDDADRDRTRARGIQLILIPAQKNVLAARGGSRLLGVCREAGERQKREEHHKAQDCCSYSLHRRHLSEPVARVLRIPGALIGFHKRRS